MTLLHTPGFLAAVLKLPSLRVANPGAMGYAKKGRKILSGGASKGGYP